MVPPRIVPSPRRSSTGLLWAVVAGVALVCLLPVGALVFLGTRTAGPALGCAFAGDTIGVSLRDYAAAHGGRLPPAESWQSELRPYYERARGAAGAAGGLALPAPDEGWGCGASGERSAFVFNAALGGRVAAELKDPERQVVVFETSGPARPDRSEPFEPGRVGAPPRVGGLPRAWYGVSATFGRLDIREGGSVAPTKPIVIEPTSPDAPTIP